MGTRPAGTGWPGVISKSHTQGKGQKLLDSDPALHHPYQGGQRLHNWENPSEPPSAKLRKGWVVPHCREGRGEVPGTRPEWTWGPGWLHRQKYRPPAHSSGQREAERDLDSHGQALVEGPGPARSLAELPVGEGYAHTGPHVHTHTGSRDSTRATHRAVSTTDKCCEKIPTPEKRLPPAPSATSQTRPATPSPLLEPSRGFHRWPRPPSELEGL